MRTRESRPQEIPASSSFCLRQYRSNKVLGDALRGFQSKRTLGFLLLAFDAVLFQHGGYLAGRGLEDGHDPLRAEVDDIGLTTSGCFPLSEMFS